jgi:hypothetical protein
MLGSELAGSDRVARGSIHAMEIRMPVIITRFVVYSS